MDQHRTKDLGVSRRKQGVRSVGRNGFRSRLRREHFPGRVIPVTYHHASLPVSRLPFLYHVSPSCITSPLPVSRLPCITSPLYHVSPSCITSPLYHVSPSCITSPLPVSRLPFLYHVSPSCIIMSRVIPVTYKLLLQWLPRQAPGAGIMEADDRQVTTVFTVQPSFHRRHSTNLVSRSATIVGERRGEV